MCYYNVKLQFMYIVGITIFNINITGDENYSDLHSHVAAVIELQYMYSE